MNNNLEPMLADIFAILRKCDIPWMLIGTSASDIWMQRKNSYWKNQALDTDIGVWVNRESEFDKCLTEFAKSDYFRAAPVFPFRFSHASGQTLDISPFGGIENHHQIVHLRSTGQRGMSVKGFRESFTHCVTLEVAGVPLKVPPLEAIWALKVLAWNVRGKRSGKDLEWACRMLPAVCGRGHIEEVTRSDLQEFGKSLCAIFSKQTIQVILETLGNSDERGDICGSHGQWLTLLRNDTRFIQAVVL